MNIICVDLVMDDGNLVRIECPRKYEDELHDTMSAAMKRRDAWSPRQWDGCTAEYLGHRLETVNMARVIGRM